MRQWRWAMWRLDWAIRWAYLVFASYIDHPHGLNLQRVWKHPCSRNGHEMSHEAASSGREPSTASRPCRGEVAHRSMSKRSNIGSLPEISTSAANGFSSMVITSPWRFIGTYWYCHNNMTRSNYLRDILQPTFRLISCLLNNKSTMGQSCCLLPDTIHISPQHRCTNTI